MFGVRVLRFQGAASGTVNQKLPIWTYERPLPKRNPNALWFFTVTLDPLPFWVYWVS